MRRHGYGGDWLADFNPDQRARAESFLMRAEKKWGPLELLPRAKRSSIKAGIKSAVKNGRGRKWACWCSGFAGGYATQRRYRQEIAEGKRKEHPIHAIRKLAWYKKRGAKRLREDAERRKHPGLAPKPRSGFADMRGI